MSTATSPATQSDPDAAGRQWITPIVFIVGSGAIIVLALGLVIAFALLAAQPGNNTIVPKIDTLLNGIFGAVLPIFATWVGTVIAFTSRAPTSSKQRGLRGKQQLPPPHRPACSTG